jgi:hypothetical protein
MALNETLERLSSSAAPDGVGCDNDSDGGGDGDSSPSVAVSGVEASGGGGWSGSGDNDAGAVGFLDMVELDSLYQSLLALEQIGQGM